MLIVDFPLEGWGNSKMRSGLNQLIAAIQSEGGLLLFFFCEFFRIFSDIFSDKNQR